MGKKENQLNPNDAVCTPACIYEPVLEALGIHQFDLDPCGHPDATVPVRRSIILTDYVVSPEPAVRTLRRPQYVYGNGHKLRWRGKDVWLNPPYSQLQYGVATKKNPEGGKYPWLYKLAHEARRGVAFLPSRTSSGWWHENVLRCKQADILVQLKGRVQHIGHEYGSPFHQVLVAYNIFDPYAIVDVSLGAWREAFRPHDAFVSDLREMRR